MSNRGFDPDDRGAAVLVGFMLLLALVLIAGAAAQGTVVPEETRSIEAQHSQSIQTEMVSLGANIDRTAAAGGERATSLSLGPDYPDHGFLLFPPSAAGTVSTTPGTVQFENVSFANEFSNTAEFHAVNRNVSTNRVVYRPNYYEYPSGATVSYEHGLVGASFSQGTDRLRAATLVDGNTIRLTAVQGSVSRSTGTASLTARPASAPARAVPVESRAEAPLRLTLPTGLDASTWQAALADEPATLVDHTGSTAVLEFEPGRYRLHLGAVSLDGVTSPNATYLVNATAATVSPGERMTVEARDRYDNPVADARLVVDAPPECDVGELRTDETGTASLRCSVPGQVTVSLPSDGSPANYEFVTFTTVDRRSDTPYVRAGLESTERRFQTDAGIRDRTRLRLNYTAIDDTALSTASITIRDAAGETVTAETNDLEGISEVARWTSPWLAPGDYEATIRVRDATGAETTLSVPIGSVSASLSAEAGSDRDAGVGDELVFDGGGSTGDIVSYAWEFGDGTTATGQQVNHAYSRPGEYTVTLTVTDSDGDTETDTATVVITDSLAANAGPDRAVELDEPIQFDGSNSQGDIVSYAWNFGDGTTATGPTPTKTYQQAGTYTVTLTVTDSRGRTATDTANVTVAELPPLTADAGPDRTVEAGEGIQFDGTNSQGDIVSYAWDFGDGTTASGSRPIKSYRQAGTYTVQLTVTDDRGRTATDQATVTVNDAPPDADAGPDRTVQVGESLTFDGSLSTGNIVSYSWNFDDGTTATGQAVSKTYNTADIYDVTLTVTDEQGRTSTDQTTVRVQSASVPLQANAGDDRAVTQGQVITFDGRGSTGDIARYDWTFGDGTSGTGPTPQHAYQTTGTYTVTLTVTDSQGQTSSDTLTVNVIREEPTDPLVYVTDSTRAGGQTSTDYSGVRMTFRNTGTRDVTITNAHVRATSGRPDRIQIGGGRTGIWRDELYVNADKQAGRYKGTISIGTATANEIALSQNAVLSGGTSAPLYLYQFRPPGNGADMRGARLSVTVTYRVGGQTRQVVLDNVLVR